MMKIKFRNRQEIRSRLNLEIDKKSEVQCFLLFYRLHWRYDENRLHWRYDESRLKTSTRGNRSWIHWHIKDCHEQSVKNGNGIENECGISIVFPLCLITSQSTDFGIFTISVSIFFEKSNSIIY